MVFIKQRRHGEVCRAKIPASSEVMGVPGYRLERMTKQNSLKADFYFIRFTSTMSIPS